MFHEKQEVTLLFFYIIEEKIIIRIYFLKWNKVKQK